MSRLYRTTCDDCGLDVKVLTEATAHALTVDHHCQPPAEVFGDCATCVRRGVKVTAGRCRLCRVHDMAVTIPVKVHPDHAPTHDCPRCGITLNGAVVKGRLGYCRDCLNEARRDGVVDFNVGRPKGWRKPVPA